MLNWIRKRPRTGALAGVVMDEHHVAIALTTRNKGDLKLEVCRVVRDSETDRERLLHDSLGAAGLGYARTSTLLNPEDYHLLLVEAPDVKPEELRAAVRWRVKDLISFHIDDAVIDVFDIPGQTFRGQGKMMYAVAARASAVQSRARVLEENGLAPEIVDIPEMALRNVAALLPEDADGVALLHLEREYGLITLTRDGTLYLARRFELGWEQLQGGDTAYEDVLLELQRSLDYYESHYGAGPVRHVVISPPPVPLRGFRSFVEGNLEIPVKELELKGLLPGAPDDPRAQADGLLAIGAALRQEEVAL